MCHFRTARTFGELFGTRRIEIFRFFERVLVDQSYKLTDSDQDFEKRILNSVRYHLIGGVVTLVLNYLLSILWNMATERQMRRMR